MEARLRERVSPSCSAELPADEALVAQEIVRAAARSDITEEVTRFRAATWRTGARCPTGPSRAAASSTSCCRR